MSLEQTSAPAPICEFCGLPIEEDEQRCIALDDGRCQP